MKRKEQKLTEYVERKKKRIWINNKIKQIEEASNKNDTRKFFKEAQFLVNSNRCYRNFVKTKMVSYCQSNETFCEGGNNTFVAYKPSTPDLRS